MPAGLTSPLAAISRLTLLQRFAVSSLVVFALLGVVMALFIQRAVEQTALTEATGTARDTLSSRLIHNLPPGDLARPVTGRNKARLDAFMHRSVLSPRTVLVKVWNPSGTAIYTSEPRDAGETLKPKDELADALRGTRAHEVTDLSSAENRYDKRYATKGKLLEVYIPIRYRPHGPVLGAFEIYQTYQPVAAQISKLRTSAFEVLGGGLVALYLLLFGIVRSGSNTIRRQQSQLLKYTRDLETSYDETITLLGAFIDARDRSTEQHSSRVTRLANALGRQLHLSPEELHALERGALLHDAGKIGISDSILLKPDRLTDEELGEMHRHPEIGFERLRFASFLQDALPLVLSHHERWDGGGYPQGLKGEEIPLLARLFAIVDAYDAITSDRPYRSASSHKQAMEILRHDAGTHFDPHLVSAFDSMMEGDRGEATPEEASQLADAVSGQR